MSSVVTGGICLLERDTWGRMAVVIRTTYAVRNSTPSSWLRGVQERTIVGLGPVSALSSITGRTAGTLPRNDKCEH